MFQITLISQWSKMVGLKRCSGNFHIIHIMRFIDQNISVSEKMNDWNILAYLYYIDPINTYIDMLKHRRSNQIQRTPEVELMTYSIFFETVLDSTLDYSATYPSLKCTF